MRPRSKRQMTGGDVVDMNEVQPGVSTNAGMQPRARIEQDPTGRRRPDVARSDGRGRADDDRGQTIARIISRRRARPSSLLRL